MIRDDSDGCAARTALDNDGVDRCYCEWGDGDREKEDEGADDVADDIFAGGQYLMIWSSLMVRYRRRLRCCPRGMGGNATEVIKATVL